MHTNRTRTAFAGLLLTLFALSAAILATLNDVRSSGAAELGTRTDLPQVGVGEIFDSAQVGNWIVVVGDFTQVREEVRADAAVLSQAYAYAYDITTGDLVWLPSIDGVVRSVERISDTSFAIGGDFGTVDGVQRRRVAVIDSGQVTGVRIDTDSRVKSLAHSGNHLFGAGSFTTVNGSPSQYLFRVDLRNSSVDLAFSKTWSGFVGKPGTNGAVIVDVTADGSTAFVLHRYESIDNVSVPGIARIDVATGVVDPNWRARTTEGANIYRPGGMCGGRGAWLTDLEISPDGTFLAVANHAGDWDDIGCDTVLRFEAEGTGHVTWASRLFDAVLSVGVENDTVYAGGHFWFAPSQYSERGAFPGSGPINNPKFTPSAEFLRLQNSGQVLELSQLAALDANTGQGIDGWAPESNAFKGVTSIEVIPRGLLIGQENKQLIGVIDGFQTGNHAFIDGNPIDRNRDHAFGQPATQSSTAFSGPAGAAVDGLAFPFYSAEGPLTHTAFESNPWWQVDLGETIRLDRILLFNRTDCCSERLADASIFVSNQPLDAGLTIAQTRALPGVTEIRLPAGTPPAISTIDMNGVTGRWLRVQIPEGWLTLAEVRAFGVPANPGPVEPEPPAPDPNPEPPNPADGCTASNANGVVTLRWAAFNGEDDTYSIRANDSWVRSVDAAAPTVEIAGGDPAASWSIRSREGGVVQNMSCAFEAGPNPDPGPEPDTPICNVVRANGTTTLTWDPFNDEDDNYQVRRNGSWFTAVDSDSRSWTGPDDGQWTIRSRERGTTVDIACD